jgi:hypothetical protein
LEDKGYQLDYHTKDAFSQGVQAVLELYFYGIPVATVCLFFFPWFHLLCVVRFEACFPIVSVACKPLLSFYDVVLDHVRKMINVVQLQILKSPCTVEPAVSAFTKFAVKEIEDDAASKERLREDVPKLSLSFVVSEKMGTAGWRHEWDDHVVNITDELINDIVLDEEFSWKSRKPIADVSKAIDLDLLGFSLQACHLSSFLALSILY